MASDYSRIRADNERRYGTDIGRIGPMLLADRYDDRTHFIFELLQNAEDALARRPNWSGQRSVQFHLSHDKLTVSHFGKSFDEADVRGICGIAKSTKELTSIGRFGIGFKSVYAFTDRPEIHSGIENFAIESFVWPTAVPPIDCDSDETTIVIPLKDRKGADRVEIIAGLRRLGAGALLFLRQIEEIDWHVEDGPSGLYLRSQPEDLGDSVRRITVIGQEAGEPDTEESWLVFSRPVTTSGVTAGHVEIAFSIAKDGNPTRESIRPVAQSPLVVFFPTVLETHLGFLAQGPYRTTPSRDNAPRHDEWNRHCVQETADLLIDALHWLRDHDLLNTSALQSMPLDSATLDAGAMFEPLFHATKQALATQRLLPRFGGGHVAAVNARIARTQELRELLEPAQLAAIFGHDGDLAWLSGQISQDRTPELRQYLMRELEIAEVTPETILSHLDADFLEAQADDWMLRLYEYLNAQPALRTRAARIPLIRLADGTHVKVSENGQPNAFLPTTSETSFPTVRKAVCSTEEALDFLHALGLGEPNAVDDAVQNVLPKYRANELTLDDGDYAQDIRRVLNAFATDSKGQRDQLIAALRETPFVMAVNAGNGSRCRATPAQLYLATDRLKSLFEDVPNVLIVDDTHGCLRGEDARDLLEACGAVRNLRPLNDHSLSGEEQNELRVMAGHAETSGQKDQITDHTLLGLDGLLDTLPGLRLQKRREKARLLWEELAHLEERHSNNLFTGEYKWSHYGNYSREFDAAFVRWLNKRAWVPDANGDLQRPALVQFESLEWKQNPFLLSKIRFKPPIIDQLAAEAGIEPGVIDLLRKHGVTNVAELLARLGLQEETKNEAEALDVEEPTTQPLQNTPGSDLAPAGDSQQTARGIEADSDRGRIQVGNSSDAQRSSDPTDVPAHAGVERAPGSSGGRPFISYVGTHPEDEEADPDQLSQPARMALESRAIDLILQREPEWRRTPAFNPGYDLYVAASILRPGRWCEVKAMTGSLQDRPVGMSHTQFDCARQHGDDYWLYVVEHASDDNARIIRIRNPAGQAHTFTFDRGWISVSEPDDPQHSDAK